MSPIFFSSVQRGEKGIGLSIFLHINGGCDKKQGKALSLMNWWLTVAKEPANTNASANFFSAMASYSYMSPIQFNLTAIVDRLPEPMIS
jgi:hypothetical protein